MSWSDGCGDAPPPAGFDAQAKVGQLCAHACAYARLQAQASAQASPVEQEQEQAAATPKGEL